MSLSMHCSAMAAPQSRCTSSPRQVQAVATDPLQHNDPWRYYDSQAQSSHGQYIDYNTVTDHTKQTEVNQRWEHNHSKSEEDHTIQEDTHKSSLGPPVSKARPRTRAAAAAAAGMDPQQARIGWTYSSILGWTAIESDRLSPTSMATQVRTGVDMTQAFPRSRPLTSYTLKQVLESETDLTPLKWAPTPTQKLHPS